MTKILTNSQGKPLVATGNKTFTVTAAIDSNIQAGNIKDGVEILGVTGTYGGGAATETFKVYWYDYDGTVLKEDTVAKGGTSTAPTVPSHQYLTFREWVHGSTLTNIQHDYFNIARYICAETGVVRKVNVTSDIDYTLRIGAAKGYFDSVSIDWGDGTTETFSSNGGSVDAVHTYATAFSGYVMMTLASGSTMTTASNTDIFEVGVEEYYFCSASTVPQWAHLGKKNPYLKAVVLPEDLTELKTQFLCDYAPDVLALPPSVTTMNIVHTSRRPSGRGIKAINIPSSVTAINNGTFEGHEELVFITDSIAAASIGSTAFKGVPVTYGITFTGNITTLGGGAFMNSKFKSVSLKNGTFTSLSNYAGGMFHGCTNLEELVLPDALSITNIDSNCFMDCTSLKTITNFPSSASTIGNQAFHNCPSLKIAISFTNITSLGSSLFSYSGFTSISLAGTFTALNQYNGGMFQGCKNLTSVTIPDTITTFGNNCFNGCISLLSIPMPTALTTINAGALCGCDSVQTLTIPDTVTSVTNTNICYMYALKTLYIGENVSFPQIYDCFSNLDSLTSIDCADGWVPNQNIGYLSGSPRLTATSLETFFTHLGDNTGNTARTITLGAYNLDKLTAAQKAIATNKNYTLS